ncbi:MAG TPA: PAS domain S-box protein [Mycobacteriales bacterium]|nr:PAS domain S-box protein [Mycobacteriales bacterium]
MPDDAVLERTIAFDPATLSAREARRFVRSLLLEAGHEQWVESAELAVSEVVTNVVLHAHTTFELTVRLAGDHVRVEVVDRNPVLPRQRAYDDQATTGRGMALVEAITDAHGVTPLPDGKVVWFCVGGNGDGTAGDDLLDRWDDSTWDAEALPAAPAAAGEEATPVLLKDMPATLWFAVRRHHDAILRELSLHRAVHPECDVTEADLAQADAARDTIYTALEAGVAQARLAGQTRLPDPEAAGRRLPDTPDSIDLRLTVPSGSASAFQVMQDVLDAAERLALDGVLLVAPGLPEVVAVRDWACEQVISQLAGGSPMAWPGAEQDRFTDVVRGGMTSGHEERLAAVRDAASAVVAADEANRILAVSRPLASLLGYEVDELVGRRVVTIVPHRFREAHVAGFTRYLATGEEHVLGRPVDLPVLRRDGGEVPCTLRIDVHGTGAGHRLIVAEVQPQG